MGMRIPGGGSTPAPVSQSTVAQWQQRMQQAVPLPPPPPVVPKPTETLGNSVNTFA